jgi:hypothetical protein
MSPTRRGNSWKYIIEEQRRRIKRLLDKNLSLTYRLEKALENAYGDAVLIAAREIDCDKSAFQNDCPFTKQQMLNSEYWPD